MTPWYEIPEVLDILEVLPRVDMRFRTATVYGETRQCFVDGFVDSLNAWRSWAFERGYDPRTRVEDLVAAVTGHRLTYVHFLSDEPDLLALADTIHTLLTARFHAGRAGETMARAA